jgi:hypothetical protein
MSAEREFNKLLMDCPNEKSPIMFFFEQYQLKLVLFLLTRTPVASKAISFVPSLFWHLSADFFFSRTLA